MGASLQPTSYDFLFSNGFEERCSEDADHDELADCVETNTGIYIGPSNTGTDPRNPDTDRDGLLDGEEVFGTAGGLDLPAMGVKPVHKDILLEYDWMIDSTGCQAHSHRPTAAILQDVHDVFAKAPVPNPDQTNGINVIQDYGQGGAFSGGNLITDSNNPSAIIQSGLGSQYQEYEAANFAANRQGYFHYVLMAHEYTGGVPNSSGIAQILGHEIMVTLGCWATGINPGGAKYIRNTIVHELGHNLGLLHGGDEFCNYKPNYSSVMNYRYQFIGIDVSCRGFGGDSNAPADYSTGTRRTLNEQDLSEPAGMCTTSSVAVDWNEDGTSTGTHVTANINAYQDGSSNESPECGGTLTYLHDFDDWANLKIASISPSFYGSGSRLRTNDVTSCAPVPSYSENISWQRH